MIWGYMEIMAKKMEATIMGYIGHRIWGIWGSSYNIPESKLVRGSRNGMEPDVTPTYIVQGPKTPGLCGGILEASFS